MTTLSARATPAQHRVLRIVEGAVMNTAHAHPEWNINRRMARSIAKRAAGTLTAAWPDVLAAALSSPLSEQPGVVTHAAPGTCADIWNPPQGGASQFPTARPNGAA